MSEPILLYGHDRGKPLDKAARADLRKQLPDGHEIVEGDFATDEKWRIVAPEQPPTPDTVPPIPLLERDAPAEIGECTCGCGNAILSDEATVQDHRGRWKLDHYEPHKDTPAENRKAHERLQEMYEGDAETLKRLGLTLRKR